jgi:hypothetical protein
MTRQIINVGVADKGNGDPIRVAFSKANDNFAELYNILSNNTGGSIITTDVIGSVFADDSTLLVDGINGRIPYSVLSGAPTIPTSFDRLVNGAYELVVESDGIISSVAFPERDGGKIFLSGVEFGAIPSDPADTFPYPLVLTSQQGKVRISSNALGPRFNWEFGTDGDLEIPGNIKSEGNINIDINLADSTLRRWTFGEDGNLTLPTGSSIADAVGNAVIGSNSGTVSITNLEVMNFTQLAPSNYLWITNQYYSGSLLTSTFGSISGTAVGTTHPVVGLTQLSTSGRGSGAIFQVTVYYNGSSTTYINVGIYYNGGNQQYGTGYAVGDTVTIAGADLGGTTPENNLTFTIGNSVKNNYPAGIEGRIIYDYSNKHFLAYNGSTWTQLDNPLTPSGTKASNAYGVAGQTSYDSNYFYICIATNTWRRVALGSSY